MSELTNGERIHEATEILEAFLNNLLTEHQTRVALQYLHMSCDINDHFHGRFDCTIDGQFVVVQI